MKKPIIAITLGDPSGIGPEITVKALRRPEIYKACRPLIIGDSAVLQKAAGFCGIDLRIRKVKTPREGMYAAGAADVLDMPNVDMEKLQIGTIQAMAGKAAFDYIEKSIALAMEREVDAVVTNPINKEALRMAGIEYIGHTEAFGALTGAGDPLTMFEVRGLRVFFLTRHVSLRRACDLVTKERIMDYIERCTDALERLGVTEGTMAVAGLNPHSGEHGLFGDEEMTAVSPAVEEMKSRGFRVEGPIGADSVFHLALTGKFNSVLSLYHDQGHIATKTLDFERTIAITNGLPFLRASVDHGTAMDIAGKNLASETSTVEAILIAAKYSPYFTAEPAEKGAARNFT